MKTAQVHKLPKNNLIKTNQKFYKTELKQQTVKVLQILSIDATLMKAAASSSGMNIADNALNINDKEIGDIIKFLIEHFCKMSVRLLLRMKESFYKCKTSEELTKSIRD